MSNVQRHSENEFKKKINELQYFVINKEFWWMHTINRQTVAHKIVTCDSGKK